MGKKRNKFKKYWNKILLQSVIFNIKICWDERLLFEISQISFEMKIAILESKNANLKDNIMFEWNLKLRQNGKWLFRYKVVIWDKKHSLVKSVQFEQKELNLRKMYILNQHNFDWLDGFSNLKTIEIDKVKI